LATWNTSYTGIKKKEKIFGKIPPGYVEGTNTPNGSHSIILIKMAALRHLLDIAKVSAVEAGKAVMEVYLSGVLSPDSKPDSSPVTAADRTAHRIITDRLGRTSLPVLSEEGIHIAYSERKLWEFFWLIDPLDGTKEFIQKNGEFTINIALMQRYKAIGGIIYAPCTDTLYCGSKETGIHKNERGKVFKFSPLERRKLFDDLLQKEQLTVVASRSHPTPETTSFINRFKHATLTSMGSSLKFMLLLENQADIYPRLSTTMEWDTAAAHAILNASNRGVYTINLGSELVYNKPDLKNPPFVAF
jgi:3'(2'), 5'-bisphosphate nucleotidase